MKNSNPFKNISASPKETHRLQLERFCRRIFVIWFVFVPAKVYAQLPPGVTFPNYQLATGDKEGSGTIPPSWSLDQGYLGIDDMDGQQFLTDGYAWLKIPSELFPAAVTKIICGPWAAMSIDGTFDKGSSFWNSISGLSKGKAYRYSFLAAGNKYRNFNSTLPDFPCYKGSLRASDIIGLEFSHLLWSRNIYVIPFLGFARNEPPNGRCAVK